MPVRAFALVLTCVSIGAMVAACGAADPVPASPDHPGNAEAAAGMTPGAAEPAPDPKLAAIAAEESALAKARPVLERACFPCHTTAGAKASKLAIEHLSMDAYPFTGEHAITAGADVRVALGVESGKPATMPKKAPGTVTGADLDALVAWSRAFDASHAAGAHDHGDGGHEGHEGHEGH